MNVFQGYLSHVKIPQSEISIIWYKLYTEYDSFGNTRGVIMRKVSILDTAYVSTGKLL